MKFADLFAGTGGMRLALEQACAEQGVQPTCVFSSEINKKACKSYELNFGENPFSDITTETSFPDFDFLLAGFPCQAFSYAGKQEGFGDTRGTLFFDVERILAQKKPKYFLLENVRGLVSHNQGKTFKTIQKSLEGLGYSIDFALLNSSNFSVPQNRVRIYIVGTLGKKVKFTLRSNLGAADTHKHKRNDQFLFPSLFDETLYERLRVKDILETNVDGKYYCSNKFTQQLKLVVGEDFTKLHGCRLIDYRGGNSIHSWELGIKGKCSSDEINFMNLLMANRRRKIFGKDQDGKKLTKEQIQTFYRSNNIEAIIEGLLAKKYLSCNEGKYNPVCGNMSFEVFKFLDPNSISITLTASDTHKLGIVHNNIPRRLTPRECARLQGYPDTYKLINDDMAVYRQMGNGVSVPVIKAVLTNFLINNYECPDEHQNITALSDHDKIPA